MSKKHLPKHPFLGWDSFMNLPSFFEDEPLAAFNERSGLSISEDEKNIYIEAALPGLTADDIEVTYDNGVLWIKGEKKEEEKDKKYYQKASSAFSYHINVPGDIDEEQEVEADYKDGIMKVVFAKKKTSRPKKINIKKNK